MRVTVIALLIVLVFMLTLSILAYIEAWNMVKSSEGFMDAMLRAIASCMLVLLSILIILLCVSVSVTLYCMLSRYQASAIQDSTTLLVPAGGAVK